MQSEMIAANARRHNQSKSTTDVTMQCKLNLPRRKDAKERRTNYQAEKTQTEEEEASTS
jgi:hypothetical protein